MDSIQSKTYDPNILVQEHLRSLEDMLDRTTSYMNKVQAELRESKVQLEKRNEELDQNLRYSAYLLDSISPSEKQLKSIFSDCFLIHSPKDKIGGDTLWVRERNNRVYLASIDCTGHGIPGAMLAMAAQFTLNSVFESKEYDEADEMLYDFIVKFKNYININREINSVKDAMDLSISIIDKTTRKYKFSAINHHMTKICNRKLEKIKGSKNYFNVLEKSNLESAEFDLNPCTTYFLGSDGFKDQFGGQEDKKFGQSRLNDLLLSINRLKLDRQKEILTNAIEEWRGQKEQTDDILLIGFKIE